jgi:serine/threonine protein kinase
MQVYDSDSKRISLGQGIGRGGEAIVFTVNGRPGSLAKIYEGQIRSGYARKLAWMRDHPPDDPTLPQGHASLAWPRDLLFDKRGEVRGYLMPYIREGVVLLDVFNPKRRTQVLPEFDRRYLHRAARNLAAALGALHARGYVVGDINESNILVTPSALVTLIDTDSFQVRESNRGLTKTYFCPVAKLEYTPPELQGRSLQRIFRKPDHDAFGLGVLIYQLLMEGNHPFRAQWLREGEPPPLEERIRRGWFPYQNSRRMPVAPPPYVPELGDLHPALVGLVQRCFVGGHRQPQRRPTPEMWVQAIIEAEENLVLCSDGHYYSNHLKNCPYCESKAQETQMPLPPVRQSPAQSLPTWTPLTNPASLTALRGAQSPAVSGSVRIQIPWGRPLRRSSRYRAGTWQEVLQSLGYSSSTGGLYGAIAGALAGGMALLLGKVFGWAVLWAVGGAAAGLVRGWKLGGWVARRVGKRYSWNLVWQIIGILSGGIASGVVGWRWGSSLVWIVVAGLSGAVAGRFAGQEVFRLGHRVGWEQILTAAGMLLGGWLGWTLGELVGTGWFGRVSGDLTGRLAVWLVNKSVGGTLAWGMVGAIGGALGGSLSGLSAGAISRVLGFRE